MSIATADLYIYKDQLATLSSPLQNEAPLPQITSFPIFHQLMMEDSFYQNPQFQTILARQITKQENRFFPLEIEILKQRLARLLPEIETKLKQRYEHDKVFIDKFVLNLKISIQTGLHNFSEATMFETSKKLQCLKFMNEDEFNKFLPDIEKQVKEFWHREVLIKGTPELNPSAIQGKVVDEDVQRKVLYCIVNETYNMQNRGRKSLPSIQGMLPSQRSTSRDRTTRNPSVSPTKRRIPGIKGKPISQVLGQMPHLVIALSALINSDAKPQLGALNRFSLLRIKEAFDEEAAYLEDQLRSTLKKTRPVSMDVLSLIISKIQQNEREQIDCLLQYLPSVFNQYALTIMHSSSKRSGREILELCIGQDKDLSMQSDWRIIQLKFLDQVDVLFGKRKQVTEEEMYLQFKEKISQGIGIIKLDMPDPSGLTTNVQSARGNYVSVDEYKVVLSKHNKNKELNHMLIYPLDQENPPQKVAYICQRTLEEYRVQDIETQCWPLFIHQTVVKVDEVPKDLNYLTPGSQDEIEEFLTKNSVYLKNQDFELEQDEDSCSEFNDIYFIKGRREHEMCVRVCNGSQGNIDMMMFKAQLYKLFTAQFPDVTSPIAEEIIVMSPKNVIIEYIVIQYRAKMSIQTLFDIHLAEQYSQYKHSMRQFFSYYKLIHYLKALACSLYDLHLHGIVYGGDFSQARVFNNDKLVLEDIQLVRFVSVKEEIPMEIKRFSLFLQEVRERLKTVPKHQDPEKQRKKESILDEEFLKQICSSQNMLEISQMLKEKAKKLKIYYRMIIQNEKKQKYDSNINIGVLELFAIRDGERDYYFESEKQIIINNLVNAYIKETRKYDAITAICIYNRNQAQVNKYLSEEIKRTCRMGASLIDSESQIFYLAELRDVLKEELKTNEDIDEIDSFFSDQFMQTYDRLELWQKSLEIQSSDYRSKMTSKYGDKSVEYKSMQVSIIKKRMMLNMDERMMLKMSEMDDIRKEIHDVREFVKDQTGPDTSPSKEIRRLEYEFMKIEILFELLQNVTSDMVLKQVSQMLQKFKVDDYMTQFNDLLALKLIFLRPPDINLYKIMPLPEMRGTEPGIFQKSLVICSLVTEEKKISIIEDIIFDKEITQKVKLRELLVSYLEKHAKDKVAFAKTELQNAKVFDSIDSEVLVTQLNVLRDQWGQLNIRVLRRLIECFPKCNDQSELAFLVNSFYEGYLKQKSSKEFKEIVKMKARIQLRKMLIGAKVKDHAIELGDLLSHLEANRTELERLQVNEWSQSKEPIQLVIKTLISKTTSGRIRDSAAIIHYLSTYMKEADYNSTVEDLRLMAEYVKNNVSFYESYESCVRLREGAF